MKTDKLLESMTPLALWGFRIRIWRQEELGGRGDFNRSDLIAAKNEIASTPNPGWLKVRALDVANFFSVLPRVNAVEVVDDITREGVVLYNGWP